MSHRFSLLRRYLARRYLALLAAIAVIGAGLFWTLRLGGSQGWNEPFAPIIQVDTQDLIRRATAESSPITGDAEPIAAGPPGALRIAAAPAAAGAQSAQPSNVDSPLAAMPKNARLQVRSAKTGKGIAGATVQIMSLDPPDALELTADAGGWLAVPAGVGCAYHAWKKGHSGQSKTLDAEPIPAVITLSLIPLATVYGEVNAALYRDATVSIQRLKDPKSEVYGSATVAAVDALGRWRFENLLIQESVKELATTDGDEHLPTFRVRLSSGSLSRDLAEAVAIRMGDAVHVADPWVGAGSVVLQFRYPSGEPLVNATNLALLRADDDAASSELTEFTTDENGDVHFPVLPAGKWDCVAGFVPLGEVDVIAGGTHEVTLEGFDLITGQLIVEPGPAPPNAMNSGGQQSITYSGKTRASSLVPCAPDGCFRLDLLPHDSRGTLNVLRHIGQNSFEKLSGVSATARAGDRNVILRLTPE